MLQHLPFIMRNALRNKRRSILTLASITVSLGLLGLLLALYVALFAPAPATGSAARRIIVHHKVSLTQPLPASYRAKIEQVPGVSAICVWQWYGGTYKDQRDQKNFFARLAVDPQTIFKVHPDFIMTPEAKAAFQKERTACIADSALAKRLGWKVGDVIPLTGDIFPGNLQLKLVGTYTSDDPQEALFMSWKYISEGQPAALQGYIGSYMVLVDTPQDVSRVSQQIDGMFANSPAPTRTETEHDFAVNFLAFLGNLKLFLGAVAGAVAFTILLVCGNTIAMAVRERTRETAILRTLGFTPGQIAGFILGEAAVLGLIGGTLGALLAAGICAAVHNAPSAGFPMPLLTPAMAVVVVVAAVIIGVLSALIPAYFAARRSVLESLRFSG